MAEKDGLNRLDTKKPGYYSGARPEMLPFCPENVQRVLDVGCGEGWFGKSIKERCQAEVWGVDLHAESLMVAERLLDKALCADLSRDSDLLPDAYFDAIFFNDVLEHMIDPFTLLERIAAKLAAGGVLIASIPNMRHHKVLFQLLVKKDFPYTDAGITDKTHLRFFTCKSMIRMFKQAGYTVTRIVPINKSGSMKPVLYRLLTFGLIGSDIAYLQYVICARKS